MLKADAIQFHSSLSSKIIKNPSNSRESLSQFTVSTQLSISYMWLSKLIKIHQVTKFTKIISFVYGITLSCDYSCDISRTSCQPFPSSSRINKFHYTAIRASAVMKFLKTHILTKLMTLKIEKLNKSLTLQFQIPCSSKFRCTRVIFIFFNLSLFKLMMKGEKINIFLARKLIVLVSRINLQTNRR
jgi:hypothetical protein